MGQQAGVSRGGWPQAFLRPVGGIQVPQHAVCPRGWTPRAEDPQAKHRSFHSRNKNSYKPYSNINTGNTKLGSDKPKEPELCRRYNAGTCPNSHRDCTKGQHRAGEKLLHLCSYEDSKGRVWRGQHTKQDHRDWRWNLVTKLTSLLSPLFAIAKSSCPIINMV